jgi:hypothetical protein
VAAYAAARLAAATAGSPVITPDSFDYAGQSHESMLSGAFWGSQHPPFLPFLWKLDPRGSFMSRGVPQFLDPRPFVAINVAVGVACWVALALVAAAACRRPAIRALVFVLVLLLSLSPDVAGWDADLLSESVGLSLTALLAAAAIHYARKPERLRAVAVAVVVVALCATRDTSLLFCVAVVAALVLVVRAQWAVLAAGLVLAASIVLWGNHASDQRWKVPVRNSIALAIVNERAGPWFAAHGLPLRPETVPLLMERPTIAFESDPRAAQLRAWIDAHGRATWYRYLLTHPGYTLWPLRSLPEQADGRPAGNVGYLESSTLFRLTPYRHGVVFWVEVALAVVALGIVRTRLVVWLTAAVLLSALATIVLVPGLDRIDIQRHLIATQLSIRLVLLGLAVAAVDRVRLGALGASLARLRGPRARPATS